MCELLCAAIYTNTLTREKESKNYNKLTFEGTSGTGCICAGILLFGGILPPPPPPQKKKKKEKEKEKKRKTNLCHCMEGKQIG